MAGKLVSQNWFLQKNKAIVTLGPSGTDSERVAKQLSKNVILKSSFAEAMDFAFQNDQLCLLSCGFIKISNDVIKETWNMLHFSYYKKMKIIHTLFCDTMTMCVATSVNSNYKTPVRLAVHPSTVALLDKRKHHKVKRFYVEAKPLAIKKVTKGECDSCLCSLEQLNKEKYIISETFTPQMVWAIYTKVRS